MAQIDELVQEKIKKFSGYFFFNKLLNQKNPDAEYGARRLR